MSDEIVWTGNNLDEALAWAKEHGRPLLDYEVDEQGTLYVPGRKGPRLTVEPGDIIGVPPYEGEPFRIVNPD